MPDADNRDAAAVQRLVNILEQYRREDVDRALRDIEKGRVLKAMRRLAEAVRREPEGRELVMQNLDTIVKAIEDRR